LAKKTDKIDFFKNLSWDDLKDWAGSKIVSRGRDYQRSGYVKDLVLTSEGALIASVTGTQRYATLVDVQKGKLIDDCTCPYGTTCKHTVAVLLEALEFWKKHKEIPLCVKNDKRLELLDEDGWEDEEEEWDEEDEEEDWDRAPKKGVDRFREKEAASSKEHPPVSLQSFLEEQTKSQLVSLIQELAKKNPELRQDLEDRQALSRGTVNKIVRSIRTEIDELSSEPGWRNYWKGEGYTPDYSRVQERLESLLAQGHADEVVSLGKELLKAATRQVGMSDDDGETAMEISPCLEVVFRALPKSSLSPLQQMLWAIEAELKDEYDLCQGLEHFWKQRFKQEDWSKLADTLLEGLNKRSVGKNQESFSRDYTRDHLADRIIEALQNAGRQKEIIPFCEQEVEKTGNYARLVKRLVDAKRFKEAEEWVHKGYKATHKKWPGIANELRNILISLREKEGKQLQVTAFKVEDFLYDPTFHTFQELRKSAQKAKVWHEVDVAAREYLETGKSPHNSPTWPLPVCEIPLKETRRKQVFPLIETLIDIAIAEKDAKKVLYWYDRQKPDRFYWRWGSSQAVRIAQTVVNEYPDRAIAIWKEIAENLIAETKPKSYEAAATYLRKIGKTLKQLNKEKDWQTYTKHLREKNIRKIRFIEILDGIGGKSIIEGMK
jgi:uncharacterized Zn finger protein